MPRSRASWEYSCSFSCRRTRWWSFGQLTLIVLAHNGQAFGIWRTRYTCEISTPSLPWRGGASLFISSLLLHILIIINYSSQTAHAHSLAQWQTTNGCNYDNKPKAWLAFMRSSELYEPSRGWKTIGLICKSFCLMLEERERDPRAERVITKWDSQSRLESTWRQSSLQSPALSDDWVHTQSSRFF